MGFEAPDALYDHVIRYLPRDFELFARMNHGDQYPEAFRHAHDDVRGMADHGTEEGESHLATGSAAYERLKRENCSAIRCGKVSQQVAQDVT